MFDEKELAKFKKMNAPGGAIWFLDLVTEVRDGHGYRLRADHLAEDIAERWPDFAALSRPERLRWARAVKIEIDHRRAQDDVYEIAEAFDPEDRSAARVGLHSFRLNVENLRELTDEERREWIECARRAARGKLSPDDVQELGYKRAHMVCSAAAEIVSGIYFATVDGHTVKIGFASDVPARLRTLQTASHRPLHLLVVIAGSQADERQLHKRFAEHRVQGEWFRLSNEIKDFIEAEKARQGGGK